MFFFFSSRRRHTRLQGDWSSDVCSSDLNRKGPAADRRQAVAQRRPALVGDHKAGLGAGTDRHRAEVKAARRNPKLGWSGPGAADRVSEVAPTADENHHVAEAGDAGRLKGDVHLCGMARRQAKGTAATDGKR